MNKQHFILIALFLISLLIDLSINFMTGETVILFFFPFLVMVGVILTFFSAPRENKSNNKSLDNNTNHNSAYLKAENIVVENFNQVDKIENTYVPTNNGSSSLLRTDSTENINTPNSVASRLQHVVDLMRESRELRNIEISKLAYIMGLDKSSELENYIFGSEKPTFAFLDLFASVFGVNPEWLKFGEKSPYVHNLYFYPYPLESLGGIRALNPEKIFFIRDTSKYGRTGIILKISDFKYIIFFTTYHISSHVGGTGRLQIYSFYQLSLQLQRLDKDFVKCISISLSDSEFNRLFSGKMFPGALLQLQNHIYWWDDFTDVNYKSDTVQSYRGSYGEEFIKAQEIVRDVLSEKSHSDQ